MRRPKTILLSAGIAMLMGLTTITARGQEKRAVKSPAAERPGGPQAQFYRHSLRIDSVKAEQVAVIQRDYKSGMALVMRDTSLTEEGKRARARALVEAKNARLKSILSPSQQEKIIPGTERARPQGMTEETHPLKPNIPRP